MARIALIGGHGKIALLAQPQLTQAGHQVSSVIRNPSHASDVAATGATPVVADIESLDTGEIGELLQGHDLVLWSAGAGGGNPARTVAVDREAAIRSIDAAVAVGVPRYLMVSYFGAGPDHGVPEDNPFHTYAEAKAAADAHLRASTLAWTIVAPSGLTDDPATGAIELGAPGVAAGSVSRADVATVLAQLAGREDLAGVTVRFNGGILPIAQALDSLAGRPAG